MQLETILLSLVPSVGGLVTVYVAMQNEIQKLKGKVEALELEREEVKAMIRECVSGIHEIKIMLAKKGI